MHIRLEIATYILVIYRRIAFLFLAFATFLHVEETDVQRVCDLNLCSGSRRKVPERILESACPSVVWRLCCSLPLADEEFLRLTFEVPSHFMLEFVCGCYGSKIRFWKAIHNYLWLHGFRVAVVISGSKIRFSKAIHNQFDGKTMEYYKKRKGQRELSFRLTTNSLVIELSAIK